MFVSDHVREPDTCQATWPARVFTQISLLFILQFVQVYDLYSMTIYILCLNSEYISSVHLGSLYV
jgi:hypothetical protein